MHQSSEVSSVVPPAAIFPSTPSRQHPSLLLWSLPVSGSRWSQLLMHTRILVASRFTAKFSYSFFGQFIVCVCKTIMFPTVCNLLLVQPPTSSSTHLGLADCWLLFRLVDHRRSQRGLASNCESQRPFWTVWK